MIGTLDPNYIEKAGDYKLSQQVNLISYNSAAADNEPTRINIRSLITEFNIYEHIENNTLSGNITLTDATNVLAELPLTGFERLEFTFNTPGTAKGFDFSVESGHPLFIYKIGNRQGLNPRTQIYTLYFTSIETVRNEQRRLSRSYATSIDDMILNMLRVDLKTKKNFIFEETKGVFKFALPRNKPFAHIDMLKRYAQSKKFNNAGYLFFETSLGFNFKSYENLFALRNGFPRKELAFYTPKVKNIRNGGDRNIFSELQSVDHYKIISHFNTLKNLQEGVFASRLVTHDSFTKQFNEYDFDYHLDYGQHKHLETDAKGDVREYNGVLPYFNFEEGKAMSDFKEGTLLYDTFTTQLHNNYPPLPTQDILQQRNSQKGALSSLVIELQVPGFTGISAGDIIRYDMPSYSNKGTIHQDTDPYLSGRYLVSGVRHHVSIIGDKHTMVLECVKDSFKRAYPEENLDTFTNNEGDQYATYKQYELDDQL